MGIKYNKKYTKQKFRGIFIVVVGYFYTDFGKLIYNSIMIESRVLLRETQFFSLSLFYHGIKKATNMRKTTITKSVRDQKNCKKLIYFREREYYYINTYNTTNSNIEKNRNQGFF